MKVTYDKVSGDYVYPLSREDVKSLLRGVPSEVLGQIRSIRFGCNWATTQEARIVQKGKRYDVRVNFCLWGNKSLLLSDEDRYLKYIGIFGGKPDKVKRTVMWDSHKAKRYASFLLLHEVGHVVYVEMKHGLGFKVRSSNIEEQWCDNYASEALKSFSGRHLTTG